jgi:hypothetical protein
VASIDVVNRSMDPWVSLPPVNGFLGVEETEAGLLVLHIEDDRLVRSGPAGARVASAVLAGLGSGLRALSFDGRGGYVVATDLEAHAWNGQEGAALVGGRAPAPPAPLDSVGWTAAGGVGSLLAVAYEQNAEPGAESLRIATRAAALVFSGGAFVPFEVPPTPCATQESCRAVGESYPIAVVEQGGVPAGVYVFWSWANDVAVVAAPLAR